MARLGRVDQSSLPTADSQSWQKTFPQNGFRQKPGGMTRSKGVSRNFENSAKKRRGNFGGRHDPCVPPRAAPMVEAMAALVFG
jgi:hypothetical protein